MTDRYPPEPTPYWSATQYTKAEPRDDGTMPANVNELADAVVGRRIVKAEKRPYRPETLWVHADEAFYITLDNGTEVRMVNSENCCAFTALESFLLNPQLVDHMILGVGTTDEYTRWHIYADLGDVLALEVSWSCGNPFFYGYGFHIDVVES